VVLRSARSFIDLVRGLESALAEDERLAKLIATLNQACSSHVGHRTIARDERANVIESSGQLCETTDAEPDVF